MQPHAPTQPSPTSSSFAGLLATLASPPSKAAEDDPPWSTSGLGEDVVSLSYERALRAHARYRPSDRSADRAADRGDESLLPAGGSGVETRAEAACETDVAAAPALPMDVAQDRDLRSASVTIRLSKTECAKLHQRAAEAGLTVSAYLRSCALEAEALRTQVKQALAELKAGSKGAGKQESKGAREQGSKGMRLTRVFGHIGKLCVGLVARESA
jgi:hypothetical protein